MGGVKKAKFCFASSNLIIVFAALALIAFAANYHAQFFPLELGKHLNLTGAVVISLIIIGCLLFIIAFLGSYGALAESRCMLLAFAVIVFMFLLGELLLAVFIVSRADSGSQMNHLFRNQMEQLAKEYNPENQDDPQNWLFDTLQRNFFCCGVHGPEDWLTPNATRRLPASCCYQEQAKGLKESDLCRDGKFIPELGCLDQNTILVRDNMYLIGGTALLLAIVETVAVLVAYWLSCAIKTRDD